jgi:hypothetical protein
LESRREGDRENPKWFQGIKERLMNEVVEAYGGPFITKCDYPLVLCLFVRPSINKVMEGCEHTAGQRNGSEGKVVCVLY